MYQFEPYEGNRTLFGRLFGGRLNVRSFVAGNLSFAVTFVVLFWVAYVTIPDDPRRVGEVEPVRFFILLAVYLVMLFYSISFSIRRLHDHNRTGWWMLFHFVPIANLLLSIYLLIPGDKYDSEYGPETQGRLSLRDILGIGQAETARASS